MQVRWRPYLSSCWSPWTPMVAMKGVTVNARLLRGYCVGHLEEILLGIINMRSCMPAECGKRGVRNRRGVPSAGMHVWHDVACRVCVVVIHTLLAVAAAALVSSWVVPPDQPLDLQVRAVLLLAGLLGLCCWAATRMCHCAYTAVHWFLCGCVRSSVAVLQLCMTRNRSMRVCVACIRGAWVTAESADLWLHCAWAEAALHLPPPDDLSRRVLRRLLAGLTH